jgi:hypothetical protein
MKKFESYFKQYINEAKTATEISLIKFLQFCKIQTRLTLDDKNTINQIYKEGAKFVKLRSKKLEVENIINKSFKVK